MAWLDAILLALAERLIMRAVARGKAELEKQKDALEKDFERKEFNAESVKRYNDAKSRQTRREAALRVLNRR